MRYVIIGNSAAAIACVEGIRETDQNGEIVVVSAEDEFTYSRPLISYYLAEEISEMAMDYRPRDFYDKNRVTLLQGRTALTVHSNKKMVTLNDKTMLFYDKLLIATGSLPILPPIPGLKECESKYTFLSFADAVALKKAANIEKRVVILGGGLIGLKCAEGLTNKVASLTLIDREDHLLPSILDKESADYVQRVAASKGISCILGETVTEVQENKVICSNGKEISFDLLVVAAGVTPNIKLLKKCGVAVNRGIIVNEKNETTVKDIYAAGDCVESVDCVDGKKKLLALLPNAVMGGRNAGRNMAGIDSCFDKTMAVNALKFWGNHLVSAGVYGQKTYVAKDEANFKKLFYDNKHLLGFIMIGDVKSAGIYTAMIREKTPLKEVDFELLKETPMLIAFGSKVRKNVLGGRDEN